MEVLRVLFNPLKGLFDGKSADSNAKNAVQSLVWLCGVVSVPCFYLATRADPVLRPWLVFFGALPIAQFLVAYNFFMLRDPDRLGSEEHQARMKVLKFLDEKHGEIKIGSYDLRNITNPEPKKLPGPGKGDAK